MNEKELIILAIYFNVGTQSEVKARTRLAETQAMYAELFNDVGKQVKIFWFPVINQPTKVECIYPVSPNHVFENFSGLVKEEPKIN